MGWNDHMDEDERPIDVFENVETLIADYGTFPLTDWEKEFVEAVRKQLDEGTAELSPKQAEVVSEIWEKMTSYSLVADD